MPFFRCYFCDIEQGGYEFEAELHICPRCTSTGPPVVLLLTPVHFIYRDNQGPMIGTGGRRWRMACKPSMQALRGTPATDQPPVVTCPNCRKTPEHLAALAELGLSKELAGGLRITGGECC